VLLLGLGAVLVAIGAVTALVGQTRKRR